MSDTKKPKKTNNNALIIASVVFVIIAIVVFIISISLFNSGNNDGENSGSLPFENSSSTISQSSSTIPESSSGVENSSTKPESSSGAQSSSTKPESSSGAQSSSTKPESSSVPQSSSSGSSSGEPDFTDAQRIMENARLLLGTPFLDGGSDADGFDSSGFIYYVMRKSGYDSFPRDIREQAQMGTERGFDDVREGDIMFFSNELGGRPNFAGFYAGNGKMIGCIVTSAFEGVVEANINNSYYREHFVAGVGIS